MKKSILLIALLLGVLSSAKADDGITIATYGNATGNTTRTMTLSLSRESGSTTGYCAFQADLAVPEGTTVTAVTAKYPLVNGGTVDVSTSVLNGKSTDFIVDYNQSGTSCRVIAYNYGNVSLDDTNSEILLTVTLTTTDGIDYDASTVAVSNIIFVKTDGLAGVDMNTSGVTSDSRLWGDVNVDKRVNATDIDAAITATASGSTSHGLDHFATNTGIEGAFKATDINNVINYAK